jgi:hypothetical protein
LETGRRICHHPPLPDILVSSIIIYAGKETVRTYCKLHFIAGFNSRKRTKNLGSVFRVLNSAGLSILAHTKASREHQRFYSYFHILFNWWGNVVTNQILLLAFKNTRKGEIFA